MKPPKITYEATPGGGVHEIHDYRGYQENPPRPRLLACDYCRLEVGWLWRRPVRPFSSQLSDGRGVAGFTFAGGTWNSCVQCEALVEARILDGLVGRICAVTGDLMPGLQLWYLKLIGAVFDAFEDAPGFAWKSGDLF